MEHHAEAHAAQQRAEVGHPVLPGRRAEHGVAHAHDAPVAELREAVARGRDAVAVRRLAAVQHAPDLATLEAKPEGER